ncbi:hypothetical protein SBOR_0804 [Sclerotinia borealis F-4128]|uniref:Uncharacterized protein n=1 Tax=Sclerotinia borealis (strain F-4128) TaxID=1432307 RepID=W9CW93_SCLBF|nr:hypothetical protein SBOR_0804 [Sclerotinia borealis F-4128]
MAGARTRAKGASPGGFKSLDDIPKPTRGRGKRVKTEPVEPSIESESESAANKSESQKAQSPPTNTSRTNSPESHSPSPTPVESRLDSRSTSPPKNIITSNDASSDNDVIHQEQDAERIAPLGLNKKRSRVEEPSTNSSDGTTEGNAEEVLEQRSTKRTRIQDTSTDGVEADESADPEPEIEKKPLDQQPPLDQQSPLDRPDRDHTKGWPNKKSANKTLGHKQDTPIDNIEADESANPEPEIEKKPLDQESPLTRPGRDHTKRWPNKKSMNKTLGRKQDPIVLNQCSSDEAAETAVSPSQSRSKSASQQNTTPSPYTPQKQQEHSSPEEDEHKDGPSTISHPASKLTSPSPDLRPVPQTEVVKPAPLLAKIGTNPEQRMKAASNRYIFPANYIGLTPGMSKSERILEWSMRTHFPERMTSPSKGKEVVKEDAKEVSKEVTKGSSDVCPKVPITNSCHDTDTFKVAHTERKKRTTVASCENLAKSDVPSSTRRSPRNGLVLTDPYLVAVNKAFGNHKSQSKAMPSIEQVTAFLNGYDAQQRSYNSETQMVAQKPTLPLQSTKPKRSGFVVPGRGSDEDTDMSDGNESEVIEEPKTPEAQISPEQDASPQSSWWKPFSTVATMLTSPFRKQSAAPASLPRNKLAPPPIIFKQPPTTPSAVPLKRMSKSDRKRNTRNNVQGRLGAGFETERRPPHKDVEKTRLELAGVYTAAEILALHKEQDEWAAKNGNRSPSIVANRDIHKAARASQRSAHADPVKEEIQSSTPAKTGDKRNFNYIAKTPRQKQPWNEYLRHIQDDSSEEEDEDDRDIHKAARASQRSAHADPVKEEIQSSTPAKTGDKRNFNYIAKTPRQKQPWNEYLRHIQDDSSEEEDEDDRDIHKAAQKTPSREQPWNGFLHRLWEVPYSKEEEDEFDDAYRSRWIRRRNGLYTRANATDRQLRGERIAPNDPHYTDYYRHIDAFAKQDISKPAGVQNPLNSAQLLKQAHERANGAGDIPPESENDYGYVLDERQKKVLFYPGSPYDMFSIRGSILTANHIANLKEGLPLLNPRDEFGIAIKTPQYDSTKPPRDQNTTNVFEQLCDWDKKRLDEEAEDVRAGTVLEPKHCTQTPPPKPKPGNAKLPCTFDRVPTSEAVQLAMKQANKYLPAKGSGLRNVHNMSPLAAEQDKGDRVANEPHPLFSFDFTDESLGFAFDPEVKKAIDERLSQGLISTTPMPEDIWNEHDDLPQGEVEKAVASMFEGLDARIHGSAHNGM